MKKSYTIGAAVVATLSLLAATTFAQTVNVSATANVQVPVMSAKASSTAQMRMERLAAASSTRAAMQMQRTAKQTSTVIAKSDTDITARITSLNNLLVKVNGMVKVSTTSKETIAATVQSEIANLTALKAQIDADTSTTTLKADFQSITASYRIYALIEPQIEILAQADRIDTLANLEATVSGKIQILLTAENAKGIDTAALLVTLTNTNAKIADAETQASTSIARVAGLMPDDGNATVAASNKAALQGAHADLQVGILDLATAKTDLQSLVQEIRGLRVSVTASSTTSVSSTTTQ